MILKRLEIENIRSYEKQTIDLPMGTILFEGDIGSGKSTILNAIEFALFGLGSQRGSSLLRLGATKGSTTLTFAVADEQYKIHRSLIKRGKSVVQGDDGFIESKIGRVSLSTTELKERILKILHFNEPSSPRAQSVIYRYAVFTPQEEMKEIIRQNPDKRLQTLRKAFGVEDYKIAGENAQNTNRLIRQRISYLKGQTSDLDQKEKDLEDTTNIIKKISGQITEQRKDEKRLDIQTKKIIKTLEDYQETRQKIENLQKNVIPLLQREIREKTERRHILNQETGVLNNRISEIQPKLDKLANLEKPTDKNETILSKELEEARKKDRELRRREAEIDVKLRDYHLIEEKGICPTCDRSTDTKEFKEKKEEKRKTKKELTGLIQGQEKTINEITFSIRKLQEFIHSQRELIQLEEQVKEWKHRIKRNQKEIETLADELVSINVQLKEALKVTKDLKNISIQIIKHEKERERLVTELRSIRKEINTSTGLLKGLENDIKKLKKEIDQKKQQLTKRKKLNEHQIWLTDYFIPTLDIIEKHVMVNIHHEFNQEFQRCFQILIEDPDLEIRIDENFTPIIEREGYDLDYASLSGGEKTSVALAYRLALNMIVKKVSTGMKSNLLILDEPTDGFSKEQLYKIRDILIELKCPQIIIVSHEKELEAFADQIYYVTKLGNVSKANPNK
ncbi:MAG: SMC family ATPase [Candidatus Bathyarchaeota archaeon]|nr:MAG: SMC family ATPase [Candidatus Bathyarchaeota archaeon]